METRLAQEKDLKSIQELNHQLFLNEYKKFDNTLDCNWPFTDIGKNYFKERINGQGVCFIACDDGKVVGYLTGNFVETPSSRLNFGQMAEVENMFIEDKYRSLGIGSGLMEAFMVWCKERKVKRVRLVASAGNEKAINFYLKNGFFKWELVLEKIL